MERISTCRWERKAIKYQIEIQQSERSGGTKRERGIFVFDGKFCFISYFYIWILRADRKVLTGQIQIPYNYLERKLLTFAHSPSKYICCICNVCEQSVLCSKLLVNYADWVCYNIYRSKNMFNQLLVENFTDIFCLLQQFQHPTSAASPVSLAFVNF